MKKFLVILTICMSVFSITAFASSSENPYDSFPYVDDLGNSWIAYYSLDSSGNYDVCYIFKVKNDDISTVGADSIKFGGKVDYYSWGVTSDSWTYNPGGDGTTGLTGITNTEGFYISGLDSSKFTSLNVNVHKSAIGNLNFHQPSLAEQHQVSLATLTKDFSLNSLTILKVALVGLATLLGVSLITRVVRLYL